MLPLHDTYRGWRHREITVSKPSVCRNFVQNGSSSKHVEAERQTDGRDRARVAGRLARSCVSFSSFHFIEIGQVGLFRACRSGRSQRLPEMKRRPPPKLLMVRLQWFVAQTAARASGHCASKPASTSGADRASWSRGGCPWRAAPRHKAPIEAGNGRTGDVAADLLLERAQYGSR